jgi:histone acetyltransferase (RNA polymerase elongator complex component)
MVMNRKPFIIPVFVPHMGCPHRCVFCNQVSITGYTDGRVSTEEVAARILEFLEFKGPHRDSVEVAFYGGNFLGLPETYRHALLDKAQAFVESGKVDGIRFSTRPESITENNLAALAPYSVRGVELGAQSMDDEILLLSRRGHTAQDTEDAVERLRALGV